MVFWNRGIPKISIDAEKGVVLKNNEILAELNNRYKNRQAEAKRDGFWDKLSVEWIVQALKAETIKKDGETDKSPAVLRRKMVADQESAVSVLQRGGMQGYHCSLVATWRVAPGVSRKDYKLSVTQQPAVDFSVCPGVVHLIIL